MDELFEMLSSLLGFAVSIGIVVTAVNSAKKKQQKKQAQQTLKQVKMEPTAASMKVMGTPERTPPRQVCPDACGANEDAAGKNGAKAAARQLALRLARGRGAARGWIPWTESRQQDRPGGYDLRGIRPARDGRADAQCIDHEGNTRCAGFAARGKGETIWQMNRCAC